MAVIHYNVDNLVAYFRENNLDVTTPYWYFVRRMAVPLIDRTGALEHPFKVKVLTKIPEKRETADLATLIDTRGRQIAKAATKPIIVYWSGGLDSTAALVSLLKTKTPVTVKCNRTSLFENGNFFRQQLQGNPLVKIELHEGKILKRITREELKNNILVTGELGDQIMGSVIMGEFVATKCESCEGDIIMRGKKIRKGFSLLFDYEWEPVIESFLFGFTLEGQMMFGRDAERTLQWLKPMIAKSPIPISNAFDFLWWINFNMKWQDVSLRFLTNLDVTAKDAANIHHFFSTDEFQNWSLQLPNHLGEKIDMEKVMMNAGWRTYKKAIRDYIFDYDGDQHYRAMKLKIGSLGVKPAHDIIYTRHDYKRITRDNIRLRDIINDTSRE